MFRARQTHRLRVAGLLTMCAILCFTACAEASSPTIGASAPTRTTAPAATAAAAAPAAAATPVSTTAAPHAQLLAHRRNIVFVLTDDLSSNLVGYMPHVQAMMRQGMTFTNYTVTNSLCCPSRASIFTGKFPHNTGVQSNDAPYGGWEGFVDNGNERHTFAVALRRAGYRTGFMGKYFNGYHPATTPRNPLGWTSWAGINAGGYSGFDYTMSTDGRVVHRGAKDTDYLTNVLTSQGRTFIRRSAAAGRPFALEVAPFTPHSPYIPAPADDGTFSGLHVPRTPAFNRTPAHAPRWLAARPKLTRAQITKLDNEFRLRVECVQSIDRMVMRLRQTLVATHQLANTVFVFSSDNGYHMGEYRLSAGKLTAFDTDVNVPLVVTGPGIAAGSVNRLPVENIDLAPTFEQLGHARVPASVDGHSFVALLRGRTTPWRRYSLVEHASTRPPRGDPDKQPVSAGRFGPYRALRTTRFTYVEYADGEREFYDRAHDRYQLDNVYRGLPKSRVAALHAVVARLSICAGAVACWRAALRG